MIAFGAVEICHLYISPGHNYFGHHGRAADEYPAVEVGAIECVAGHGIRGDRFFDYQRNYKGQVTFFATEVFNEVCDALGLQNRAPGLVRRNVLTRGIDLNELIGQEFDLQGVQFHGVAECRPCYWMERARRAISRRGRMPAMLLDGPGARARRGTAAERPRRFARDDCE
jgi:hypothetical protein